MAVTIQEHPPSKNHRNFAITITTTTTTTEIPTTVTTHPGVARDWIHRTLFHRRHVRHRLIVGLGVQWTPHNLSHYDNPAVTIQICIGRRCLIFQLHHSATVPRVLRRLLSDPNATFVGLWNHSDAKKLLASKHGLLIENRGMLLDLRSCVDDERESWKRSLVNASISEIALEMLGVDIEWDEEISKSDWEVEELSFGQVRQACVDAFVSFQLGLQLGAWQFNTSL